VGEYLIRGPLAIKIVVILIFCIYHKFILKREKDMWGTFVEVVPEVWLEKS